MKRIIATSVCIVNFGALSYRPLEFCMIEYSRSYMSLQAQIYETFHRVYHEQCGGRSPDELRDDTVLLETGLDSLGFAILVVNLEQDLGFDPFVISDEAYYPVTYGDFVKFYETYQPK